MPVGKRARAQNASPALGRNIERFTQYLTLVGLTALLVGGVGVANAVKHYLDRRRNMIATLKSLGATGGRVFAIYLIEVMLLAAIGAVIGLVVGAILPFAISAAFSGVLPLPIVPARASGRTGAARCSTAFSLRSLSHSGRSAARMTCRCRRFIAMPSRQSGAFRASATCGRRSGRRRAGGDRRPSRLSTARSRAIFIVAAACVFLALRLVALLIMALARRAPRPRYALLRLVLANIHRPGALTPSVVLSLGLGLALLVTLLQIDGNLRRQFVASLPDKAPSVFFVDIQDADAARFDAFARKNSPDAVYERVPMLRGRIVRRTASAPRT